MLGEPVPAKPLKVRRRGRAGRGWAGPKGRQGRERVGRRARCKGVGGKEERCKQGGRQGKVRRGGREGTWCKQGARQGRGWQEGRSFEQGRGRGVGVGAEKNKCKKQLLSATALCGRNTPASTNAAQSSDSPASNRSLCLQSPLPGVLTQHAPTLCCPRCRLWLVWSPRTQTCFCRCWGRRRRRATAQHSCRCV